MAYKKAKIARFYGFSNNEIEDLYADELQDYWLAIDAIQAEEIISSINISSFPYMKKQDREKSFNDLNKKAQSIIERENGAELSTEEAASLLARRMMRG